MRKTSFARAWVEEPEAREVYEHFLGERDPAQFLKDYVNVVLDEWGDGTHLEIVEIPLPRDFSFWQFEKEPSLELNWQSEYSENRFRRELANGVCASIRYVEGEDYVSQSWRNGNWGFYASRGYHWTNQFALEILPKRIEALGRRGEWPVDWGFVQENFAPLIVDVRTGLRIEDDGFVKCKSLQHSWEISQRLMAAHDLKPTHMGGSALLDFKHPLQSYAEQYKSLQKTHPTWTISLCGTYAEGFDPFVRPKKVPRQGWHFPLARREQDNRCGAQLNMVHQPSGSYLELMTEFGPSVLRDWTKRLKPKLKWEIWKGDPAQRWDGDATPVRTPKPPNAPPLMFRNELDSLFGCFVHHRKLTLMIHSPSYAPAPTREEQDHRMALRLKRSWAGYNSQECDHWAIIDAIESRFDEIAARYTGWDSIRFWWPNPAREHPKLAKMYWKDRPMMHKMKTLPMKVHGKTLQIPVEFVEPLKCPM